MSRARQRRAAVARWRYAKRLEALNAVRHSYIRPRMWIDDKPVWLAAPLDRFMAGVSRPKPRRTPRTFRRLTPEQQQWVLWMLTNPAGAVVMPRRSGKTAMSAALRSMTRYGGA